MSDKTGRWTDVDTSQDPPKRKRIWKSLLLLVGVGAVTVYAFSPDARHLYRYGDLSQNDPPPEQP